MKFFVIGRPVPAPRPRVYARAGGVTTVSNTARVKAWKRAVATVAQAEALGKGLGRLEGPVRVSLAFLLPRPKRLKGDPPHIGRGDVDNYAKAVIDAMAGLWGDDGQVVDLRVTKAYAPQGGQAGVTVEVGCVN